MNKFDFIFLYRVQICIFIHFKARFYATNVERIYFQRALGWVGEGAHPFQLPRPHHLVALVTHALAFRRTEYYNVTTISLYNCIHGCFVSFCFLRFITVAGVAIISIVVCIVIMIFATSNAIWSTR